MVSIASQFEFWDIWLISSASFASFALGYIVVFSNFYALSSIDSGLGWSPSGKSNASHMSGEWPTRFRDVMCPMLFALAAFCLAFGCTLHFPPAYALAGTVLGVGLLTLTMIDIRHYLLPDIFTGLLGLSGLVFLAWRDPGALAIHALSGLLAFAVIAGLGDVYRRWRGHDGIGLGDAKLMAVAGIWLGPAALGPLLFLSALLALGFLIVARLSGRIVSRRTAIPFGAFLSPVMFALWCLQSVPD